MGLPFPGGDHKDGGICHDAPGRYEYGFPVFKLYSYVYRRFAGRYGGRHQDDDVCYVDIGGAVRGQGRK